MANTPLYEGKCKQLFASEKKGELIQVFKDDTTAFDGKKRELIANKGRLNCAISTFFFEQLHDAGIASHFIQRTSAIEMLVKRLDMIPVEVVVRNYAAGSLCRRLGVEQGLELAYPLTELFYKSDALGDPMINREHAVLFGWAKRREIDWISDMALEVNRVLTTILADVGIRLADFKLEFGRSGSALLVGDEITPDSCRLWDIKTGRKLDKDLFRQDLGGLSEAYFEVATRLGIKV